MFMNVLWFSKENTHVLMTIVKSVKVQTGFNSMLESKGQELKRETTELEAALTLALQCCLHVMRSCVV